MIQVISREDYNKGKYSPYDIVQPIYPGLVKRPYIQYEDCKLYEGSIIEGVFYYSHQDSSRQFPSKIRKTGQDTSYEDYFKFTGRITSLRSPDNIELDCSTEFESLRFKVNGIHMYITKVIKAAKKEVFNYEQSS